MFKQKFSDIEEALDKLEVSTGRTFYVMPSTDPGYQDFIKRKGRYIDGVAKVYNSVADGYNAMTSNNNDYLYLSAYGYHEITAMITVSKSRCNFRGMDGGGRVVQQGARLRMATTTAVTDLSPVKVTGTRNTFKNIKFVNENALSQSIYGHQELGEGTYYENCSFVHIAHLADATAADALIVSDSATFRECEFGADTVQTTDARTNMLVKTTSSAVLKDTHFIDCSWKQNSTSTSASNIKIDADGDFLFGNIMRNPIFYAWYHQGGVALTAAIVAPASSTTGDILLVNPICMGPAKICATGAAGGIKGVAPVPTAATSGIAIDLKS